MQPNLATLSFVACLAATLYMTGVIWAVQLALYPLFTQVDPASFQSYHQLHEGRITLVVLPPMLLELGTSLLLLLLPLPGVPRWPTYAALGLLAIVWGVTFFVSVPYHSMLEHASGSGRAAAISGLIASNWLRTVAWTLRSLLLLYLAALALSR